MGMQVTLYENISEEILLPEEQLNFAATPYFALKRKVMGAYGVDSQERDLLLSYFSRRDIRHVCLMYLAGGDAISYFYENQGTAVSQEIMDAMRKKYGLDQPFLMQYGHWLLHALMGDMGESYVSGRAVLPFIASKIPHTLYLAAVSIALTLVVSIPLGVLSAVRKDGWCDSLAGGLSFLGNAMPNFFVAILLIYLLAVKLKWFPAVSVGTSPSVVLPAVTLAIAMSAKYTRQIRGVVLAELRKAT